MPDIAVVTSECDNVECLLLNVGVDKTEFVMGASSRITATWGQGVPHPVRSPRDTRETARVHDLRALLVPTEQREGPGGAEMRRANVVVPILALVVVAVEAAGVGCGTGTDVPSGPGGAATGTDAAGIVADGQTSTDGGAMTRDDACQAPSCRLPPCASGKETAIVGVVRAPNGKTPIYNAIVYIPTAPVAPFPDGVVCDRCGAVPPGAPITTTLTLVDGSFALSDVPPGVDVPIVVQIGKWRRQARIPSVPRCETTVVSPDTIRLPRNKGEGSMPHIAVTTGCDAPGCSLKKIGIDPASSGRRRPLRERFTSSRVATTGSRRIPRRSSSGRTPRSSRRTTRSSSRASAVRTSRPRGAPARAPSES
jgi:hypothetical protein